MIKQSIAKKLFAIISIFTIIVSSLAYISNSSAASAEGACYGSVGSGMVRMKVDNSPSTVSNPDVANRKWTAEELFRNSVTFSSFYGEGKATWFFAEKVDRGKDVDGWTSEIQTKLEGARSFSCVMGNFDWIPQAFFTLSSGITWLTGAAMNGLIGEDKMAKAITDVVGGKEGDEGGLIGTFFSSFYSPLVVIAFLIMAVTLIYKGLFKRQLREAFSSILWSIGAFVIGVAMMLNPQLLASAPQAVTSTITTCVIGSLSGQNCLSGDVTTPSLLSGKECLSATGSGGHNSEGVVNSLNCTIWKAFILEPWAETQFGAPYDNLYTKDPPEGAKLWSELPEGKGDKYCISMTSSKSFIEATQNNSAPIMDVGGDSICNVALYHLFIKTGMKDTANQDGNNFDSKGVMVEDDTSVYDKRWYDIIVPMAQSETKWESWAGIGMFWEKMKVTVLSLVGTIAASSVLITLAFFAGAYKIIGLIMIALAPVFLLLAIEPTKGKKIFLGWLETMVSSFLKYFAIMVLIIVSLVMYAGLLSNTSGVTSLVAIIAMTVALHMYRKEIVDLIGASNMGGQKLSNKANELGSKLAKGVKTKGQAALGGAFGGAVADIKGRSRMIEARKDNIERLQQGLANATSEEDRESFRQAIATEKDALANEKTLIGAATKGAFDGTKESVGRSFKKGTGTFANVAQQKGRTSKDNERILSEYQKSAEKTLQTLATSAATSAASTVIPPMVGLPGLEGLGESLNGEGILPDLNSVASPGAEDFGLAKEVLKSSQRETFNIPEGLSAEEKEELNNFADKLTGDSDSELINMANKESLGEDENKKAIVANEINARIKANSMLGIASNELSRNPLADPKYLSDEELTFNYKMHSENYLETGNPEELQMYVNAGTELASRSGIDFDPIDAEVRMKEFKEQVGDNYQRDPNFPTEDEIKGKEEFSFTMSNGETVNFSNVTTPTSLAEEKAKHIDKITEVRAVEQVVNVSESQADVAPSTNAGNENSTSTVLPAIEDQQEYKPPQEQIVVPDRQTREETKPLGAMPVIEEIVSPVEETIEAPQKQEEIDSLDSMLDEFNNIEDEAPNPPVPRKREE